MVQSYQNQAISSRLGMSNNSQRRLSRERDTINKPSSSLQLPSNISKKIQNRRQESFKQYLIDLEREKDTFYTHVSDQPQKNNTVLLPTLKKEIIKVSGQPEACCTFLIGSRIPSFKKFDWESRKTQPPSPQTQHNPSRQGFFLRRMNYLRKMEEESKNNIHKRIQIVIDTENGGIEIAGNRIKVRYRRIVNRKEIKEEVVIRNNRPEVWTNLEMERVRIEEMAKMRIAQKEAALKQELQKKKGEEKEKEKEKEKVIPVIGKVAESTLELFGQHLKSDAEKQKEKEGGKGTAPEKPSLKNPEESMPSIINEAPKLNDNPFINATLSGNAVSISIGDLFGIKKNSNVYQQPIPQPYPSNNPIQIFQTKPQSQPHTTLFPVISPPTYQPQGTQIQNPLFQPPGSYNLFPQQNQSFQQSHNPVYKSEVLQSVSQQNVNSALSLFNKARNPTGQVSAMFSQQAPQTNKPSATTFGRNTREKGPPRAYG